MPTFVDHVCNLREFKVYIKTGHDSRQCEWIQVLHSGLRNDSEPETFPLGYPSWDLPVPAPKVG